MEIEVSQETHVLVLNDRTWTVKSEISLRGKRIGNSPKDPEFSLYIDNRYKAWEKENRYTIEDCRRSLDYGRFPFSLDTYMEWCKDPRIHYFAINQGSIRWNQGQEWAFIGTLVVSTFVSSNPFILPVRTNSRCERTVVVRIEEAVLDKGGLFCSGDLVDQAKQGDWVEQTYHIDRLVDSDQICVYLHEDMHLNMVAGEPLSILSKEPVTAMLHLQIKDSYQRAKKVCSPRSMTVVIGQDTPIQEAEGIVFTSSTHPQPLYEQLVKSWLRLNVKDEWLVQGWSTYSQDIKQQFQNIKELASLVKQGEEFRPLSDGSYSLDRSWRLRAKVIFTALANIYQKTGFMESIMELAAHQQVVTTPVFVKYIKDRCGLMNLDSFVNQFINATGLPKLRYRLGSTAQKGVNMYITQKPLQLQTLQYYNSARMKLEQVHNCSQGTLAGYLYSKYENFKMSLPLEWPSKPNELDRWLMVPQVLASHPYYSRFLEITFVEKSEADGYEEKCSYGLNRILTTKKLIARRQYMPAIIENGNPQEPKRKPTKQGEDKQDSINSLIKQVKAKPKKERTRIKWTRIDECWKMPSIVENEAASLDYFKCIVQEQTNEREFIRFLSFIKERKDIKPEIANVILVRLRDDETPLVIKRAIISTLPRFLRFKNEPITINKVWSEFYIQVELMHTSCQNRNAAPHLRNMALLQALSEIAPEDKEAAMPRLQFFHERLIQIAKLPPRHYLSLSQQQQFASALYMAMLNWRSEYTLEVVGCLASRFARHKLEMATYLPVFRKVFPRLRQYLAELTQSAKQTALAILAQKQMLSIVEMDGSDILELDVAFEQLARKERQVATPEFLHDVFATIDTVKAKFPKLYAQSLSKAYQLLRASRQKYSYDFQAQPSNLNKNCVLAYYFWEQLTDPSTCRNAEVRLHWMKIYRLFYFYFTPIAAVAKISQAKPSLRTKTGPKTSYDLTEDDRRRVLASLKDFAVDKKWLLDFTSVGQPKNKPGPKQPIKDSNGIEQKHTDNADEKKSDNSRQHRRQQQKKRTSAVTNSTQPAAPQFETLLENGQMLFMEDEDEEKAKDPEPIGEERNSRE